jgi:hypothetical protein
LALVAACLLSAPARAQEASERAEGRALFDEGMKLFAEQRFAEACPKFEASLRRLPGIGTRGKLAECYEKIGRTASAWALYRETASLAGRAGDATREKVASERARALEPNLSRLTISVPPGRDVAGLVVKRNGEPLEHAVLGTPMPIDPGKARIEVSASGRVSQEAEIEIQPGQSASFEVPELAPEPQAAAPPAAPSAGAPDTGPEQQRTWQKPVGLVVGGVGVAFVITGALFALAADGEYDEAFDKGLCDSSTNQCNAEGQSQTEDARSKAAVATVLYVAGIALGAGGAVLFFTAPENRDTAVRVTPAVTTQFAGVSLRGGF